MLLSFCLILCQFQPGVAYKGVAYKKSMYFKVSFARYVHWDKPINLSLLLWSKGKINVSAILTHLSLVSDFYNLWKRQKTKDFLTFSGGVEMWHWNEMG